MEDILKAIINSVLPYIGDIVTGAAAGVAAAMTIAALHYVAWRQAVNAWNRWTGAAAQNNINPDEIDEAPEAGAPEAGAPAQADLVPAAGPDFLPVPFDGTFWSLLANIFIFLASLSIAEALQNPQRSALTHLTHFIMIIAVRAYSNALYYTWSALTSFYKNPYPVIEYTKQIFNQGKSYFESWSVEKFSNPLSMNRFNFKRKPPNLPPPEPDPTFVSIWEKEKTRTTDYLFSKCDFINDIFTFLHNVYVSALHYLIEFFPVYLHYLSKILYFLSNCFEIIRDFIRSDYFFIYEIIRIIIEIITSIFS